MGHLFKRLQRAHRSEAALCFGSRGFRWDPLADELLNAEFDVERNFSVDVATSDIATS